MNDIDIQTIPKLIQSTDYYSYINYITGAIIGGGSYKCVLLLNPKVAITLGLLKIFGYLSSISIGSYLFNEFNLNYYKIFYNIQKYCIQNDQRFITHLDKSQMFLIYGDIYDILTSKNHPIGNINYKFLELYTKKDNSYNIMKYHVYQITKLIQVVYNLHSYDKAIHLYTITCIERTISKLNYRYIVNLNTNIL